MISAARFPYRSILVAVARALSMFGGSWFVREPFDATVGAGDGGRYWLLDFVRQGGSHFPQHAHTIDVRELGLQLAQLFMLLLSTFVIGDVSRTARELH
jgi:hypothetical protein